MAHHRLKSEVCNNAEHRGQRCYTEKIRQINHKHSKPFCHECQVYDRLHCTVRISEPQYVGSDHPIHKIYSIQTFLPCVKNVSRNFCYYSICMNVPSRTHENGKQSTYFYLHMTCTVLSRIQVDLKFSIKAQYPCLFSQQSTFVIPPKQRFRVNDLYFH